MTSLTKQVICSLFWLSCFSQSVKGKTSSFEVWGASEFQLMLSPETDPNLAWHDIIPDRLRIYSEHQFAHDLGLKQALLRIGPIWQLLPNFSIAAHAVSAAQPTSNGQFQQEVRLELEPTIKGRWLDLHWANRHRLEYRWRTELAFWRYRTRLALHYPIPDSSWTPFVSNELHFELDGAGFQQNRLLLGLSCQINPSMQLSLAYLNRQIRDDKGWVPEQGLMLSLFYASREMGLFQAQAD